MKLFICEKPSQAADLANVLGNARKTQTYWETAGGLVTWCFGHLLELDSPEDYDERYKKWNFADLPIIPQPFRFSPKREGAGQLRAIGNILKESSQVVIATDADREGEMIGREVLAHFRYSGPVQRLWLTALDKTSIQKALTRIKPGAETIAYYHAALGRSEADWLVGMNISRAMTLKQAGTGVFSVGRVQTPTLALVVNRDREIENFQSRSFYDLTVHIKTAAGAVTLNYTPRDEERIWDLIRAQKIASAAQGQLVTLQRETTAKKKTPPALFALSGLQKKANALWGWPADKTLEIAQALYETHKATTYPRVDNEYLPEEQIADVTGICAILCQLEAFQHLAARQFTPRKGVYNTAKAQPHHAIVPTKTEPQLSRMNSDELKAYLLIAAHYIGSLLPDFEYDSTKLSATISNLEFAIIGNTPVKNGWKDAFSNGDGDDETELEVLVPNIANGTRGTVERASVETKQTKPPARYTEGTLIADMKAVAKFVTDPAKKIRLKDSSGIGTEATRANIIKTIKDRSYVVTKGKQLISTEKGRALIGVLESELPALADPAETAVWEEALESVANGHTATEEFVSDVGGRIRDYLAVLGKKPDIVQNTGPSGERTGHEIAGNEVLDHGDFFTCRSSFAGRIYKNIWGHELTPGELVQLVEGKKTLQFDDCTTRDGSHAGPRKFVYNEKKKPYPGVETVDASAPGTSTSVLSPRGNGQIQDHGEYFVVPGVETSGRPTRFYKKLAGRPISADELARILESKSEGIVLTGFFKADGTPFKGDPRVRYNPRKKPFPGLDFVF